MVLLVHSNLLPQCRKIRVLMAEKKMLFVLKEENPWALSKDILKINPAGELPIFIFDGNILAGNYAITEFLEETYSQNKLIVGNNKERAEVRRLTDWFDNKFNREVYQYIAGEKIYKRFVLKLPPESRRIKAGINNLRFHMEYIDWLTERSNYLAGAEFSMADISAAAQISIIDYLGDIPWEDYKNAKLWYSKIKSRPSFKEILNDRIKGVYPSKHYTDLDF
ncbi:MAG: glutathione S-transferase family protein [Alphaproteobacteria bacterium]|nr:glutathione S-transferase family protein [Alphaproteobacteria bacterium]MBR3661799.1 glutathione S-transferase family protein [Alphaproteobacteria bacterium]